MFSLIVTLISIALVAALALASMYYLNNAHEKVGALTRGATALSQAEQLAGAARLYKAYELTWPTDFSSMQTKAYLTTVPVFEGRNWQSLGSSVPAYLLKEALDAKSCRSLNSLVRSGSGVYNEAVFSLKIQCFGSTAPYSVLVHTDPSPDLATALGAAIPGATLVASTTDATWALTPE